MTTVLKRNEWDVLAWGVNSKNASSVSSGSTEKKKSARDINGAEARRKAKCAISGMLLNKNYPSVI